jgi:crotonobetainyl-CoA:carnitine CoA-transferase CaiB-like acyl-CoA transferase
MGALTAILSRSASGRGQYVDVSMLAAANVSTEQTSYKWLVSGEEVFRQTGRHAASVWTVPTQILARDGRWVNTGVPSRDGRTCAVLLAWLDELGLRDEVPEVFFLDLGVELGQFPESDEAVEGAEIVRAQRAALEVIASHLSAYDFFLGAQSRGLTGAVVYSPEEALDDPQIRARGAVVAYDAPEVGLVETIGPAIEFGEGRVALERAPRAGQHQDEIEQLAASPKGTPIEESE